MRKMKKALSMLLVLSMVFGMTLSVRAEEYVADNAAQGEASSTETKPEDGTTSGQPFPTDIGVGHYRIPALTTLSDGSVVAAADARWGEWQQPDDCANIDTIVSRSTDNGKNWNYTFANYIADNGNARDMTAATFIDPALAYDGNTLYMVVDLFPGQASGSNSNCSVAAKTGTGFDSEGNLLLKEKANATDFNYYLKEGKIHQTSDNSEVSGYTVDAYFNLSKDGTNLGNLFTYSADYFQPLMTSYLYLTKSTDGGATWTEPTLLNLKNTTEQDYLVSPGRGLVASDGTIIFPCYTYSGSTVSLIYSTDKGNTWKRTGTVSFDSSEGDLVELADGTLRYFYRHSDNTIQLCYVDVTKDDQDGYTFGNSVTVSGVSVYSNCNLSAITYSKTVGGKQVILVSCPTSNRTTGKIFTFTVGDGNALNLCSTYEVNGSAAYSYSSLTELSDGSIGLLYENGDNGNISYTNLQIGTVAAGVNFDEAGDSSGDQDAENPAQGSDIPVANTVEVVLYAGQSSTYTIDGADYSSNVGEYDTNVANVQAEYKQVEGSTEYKKIATITSGSSYLISDGNGNYLTLSGSSLTNSTDPATATQWTITSSGSGYKIYGVSDNGTYYLRYSNLKLSATTNSSSATTWSYSSDKGIYYSSSSWSGMTYYYLRSSGTNWQASTTNSNNGAPYIEVSTEPVSITSVTITGVVAGTTSVVVGNTQYNITVKEKPELETMDTTPFVGGSGQGEGEAITGLVISAGTNYTLALDDKYRDAVVTWKSENENYVTVAADGTVTGVSEGETTITATIDGVQYTIPVTVVAGPSSTSRYAVDVYNSQVTNCTAYYSLNSNDLVEFPVGTQLYVEYDTTSTQLITFFATPNEGYALTYVNGTGGSYFHSVRNADGTEYGYEGTHSDSLAMQDGGYAYIHDQLIAYVVNNSKAATAEEVHAMLSNAVGKKCDGAFFFSRKASDSSGIATVTTFIAERLPSVEKSVSKINGSDYQEGITEINVEDTITFDVSVTQYAPSGTYDGNSITYENETLQDNLDGAVFDNNTANTVPNLSDNALSSDTTTHYDVTYVVKESDLDTKIVNTVDLTYTYQATYSKGSFSAEAKAEAAVSVLSGIPDDIVVDFGLPVTIDLSNITSYDFESGQATYGKIRIEEGGRQITYTPDTVLRGIDTVTLINEKGAEYVFKVYPATTVYYEENFATLNDYLQSGTPLNNLQTTQVAGNSTDNYGYDEVYADDITNNMTDSSNGTYAVSNTKGDTAVFEFTGTGADLFVNSGENTGNIAVQVRDSSNKLVKVATIQTTSYSTIAGKYSNSDEKNLIAFSIMELPYGSYTVKVTTTSDGQPVYFDGFRVYGTLEDQQNEVYIADKEDDPTYIELRDYVLTALSVDNTASSADVYAQVREATSGELFGVVLSQYGSSDESGYDGNALLENGPKNELFLLPGDSVTFKINTNREVQVGLKAPSSSTTYTINGGQENTISTSTDMFYTVLNNVSGDPKEQEVVINNMGASLLAVTKIKVCDDPDVTMCELTEEDIEMAMDYMNRSSESETAYADATLTIAVNDVSGNELVTTTLAANGVTGEIHTFTAAEIETAVEALELPEGYKLGEMTYGEQEVVYGEESTVTFIASEDTVESVEPENPEPTPDEPTSIIGKIISSITNFFEKLFGRR